MTYSEIYEKALNTLNLNQTDIEDYRPACELEQIKCAIPGAIIIWLKTGDKVIFIDKIGKEKRWRIFDKETGETIYYFFNDDSEKVIEDIERKFGKLADRIGFELNMED